MLYSYICWSLTTPQNQEYKDHPERFKDSLPEDDSEHSPKLKKGRRVLGRSTSNAGEIKLVYVYRVYSVCIHYMYVHYYNYASVRMRKRGIR